MEFQLSHNGRLRRLALSEGEHLVGRAPESALLLDAPEVSFRHARLSVRDGRLFVRDLGSTNGTLVDGTALTAAAGEVEVPPGAALEFAGVRLERLDGAAPAPVPVPPSGPVLRTTGPPGEDVTRITRGSYSIGQGYSDAARARLSEMLSSLFELIAAEGGSGSLGIQACEFVSRWVDADRVVLLEDSGEGTAIEPSACWSVETRAVCESASEVHLSRTLVQRVMDERTSVLLMDVAGGGSGPSESMVALQLRSAMAVPLFDNERVRGILYVDSARPETRFGEDDLQVVTATANAVAVKLRNLTLERELATAARIQRALIPSRLPDIGGFELLARLDMCRAVGGDLYHVACRPDGTVLLALGDVAGKGTPAALAMSACLVLISTLAEIGGDIGEVMAVLQRKLYESLAPEQFITLFLAELDPASGRLAYVNAGHELPLCITAAGGLEELPPCGPPVALIPEARWRRGECALAPGDLLAVFSDGIPEATLDGDRFLGLDEVKTILTARRGEPLGALSAAIADLVNGFLRGGHASDDVTLMLLRRRG